jgi:prolyl oligopeptidase
LTTDLIKAFLDYKEGHISLYLKINKKTLMKKLILIMAVLPTIACLDKTKNQFNIQKPEGETVDLYFDAKVADPYRWLEDDRSAETAAGLAENKVTYGYLNQIPFAMH